MIRTSGAATTYAGDGSDTIRAWERDGQSGGPTLFGEGGDDYIDVYANNATVHGGDGGDGI